MKAFPTPWWSSSNLAPHWLLFWPHLLLLSKIKALSSFGLSCFQGCNRHCPHLMPPQILQSRRWREAGRVLVCMWMQEGVFDGIGRVSWVQAAGEGGRDTSVSMTECRLLPWVQSGWLLQQGDIRRDSCSRERWPTGEKEEALGWRSGLCVCWDQGILKACSSCGDYCHISGHKEVYLHCVAHAG